MALPEDGLVVALDFSEEWTATARRYWREAGVEHKIDLRLGEAVESPGRPPGYGPRPEPSTWPSSTPTR